MEGLLPREMYSLTCNEKIDPIEYSGTALICRFLSRNSLVFEISRYLAKKLENRTNIDRLIYIKE